MVDGSERRQSGTKSYSCNGHDTGGRHWTTDTCYKAVYDDWYFYRLWEWTHTRDFVAAGGKQDELAWPDASDIDDKNPHNPERLGLRVSHDEAELRDKDQTVTIDITDSLYGEMSAGDQIILVRNFWGTPESLKWPPGKGGKW